jgi:hypothetical protein
MMLAKNEQGEIVNIMSTDPRRLSGELVSINKGFTLVVDKGGNYYRVRVNDPRYRSGELVHAQKGRSNKGAIKGKMLVIDKDGNITKTSVDDPLIKNGELRSIQMGKVLVVDKEGNTSTVTVTDPRYISGELKFINAGKAYSVCSVTGEAVGWVSIDDPRYISGEIVSLRTYKSNHRDKKLTRPCLGCGTTLSYKTEDTCKSADKKGQMCHPCSMKNRKRPKNRFSPSPYFLLTLSIDHE